MCASSIEQARIVFRFVRANLGDSTDYRFLDSLSRIGITHKATATRLRVISSNGKGAMGIVGSPIVVADEPGAWEVTGGGLMADAILTGLGKPESPMKAIFIGTLAPSTSGWWHDLIKDGTQGSSHVTLLQGDADKWDQWAEIRRCNPLVAVSEPFRRKLLEERDKAREDTRLKARFLSYRLNLPSADESETLLTVDDFDRMASRPVPDRAGRPIVAVDLGGGRAWSAATAVWQNRAVSRRWPSRRASPAWRNRNAATG